jgi:hypothetical protein
MNEPEFMTDGKEFYVLFNTPLVRGYMPVPIPKSDPVLRWNGPKINLVNAWYPALKFMKDHLQHEVVLRLFMSRDKETIYVMPLTQIYGTGMSVKEEITKEEREWWAAEGLIEAGTIHSHCTAGAFASGTDKSDEKHRDGLHLTVGKLNQSRFDIHARMVWTVPGEEGPDGKLIRASAVTVQEPNLRDWFILPEHVERFVSLEPELEQSVLDYMLCKPPGPGVSYPKEWKDKLLQKPAIPHHGGPQAWTRGIDGQMHMYGPMAYEPETSAYPMYGKNLSRPEDIPGHGEFKKKESEDPKAGEDQNGRISAKAALLWDLWSEVMVVVTDAAKLRHAGVRVADFRSPLTREILFARHGEEARDVWEHIQRMFTANNVTEEEFFESWDKTSWPIDDNDYAN